MGCVDRRSIHGNARRRLPEFDLPGRKNPALCVRSCLLPDAPSTDALTELPMADGPGATQRAHLARHTAAPGTREYKRKVPVSQRRRAELAVPWAIRRTLQDAATGWGWTQK